LNNDIAIWEKEGGEKVMRYDKLYRFFLISEK